MLVGLNEQGLVQDFYYPYVGMDNLTTARSVQHKIGVWADGQFSWIDDGSWDIKAGFEDDALVSNTTAESSQLGLRIQFHDFVDVEFTAFCRQLEVTDLHNQQRDIRVFFHQVFQISNDGRADTALFVPQSNYIFDYKGHCSLLIFSHDDAKQPFDQFAVGNYGIEGKEGTFKDAEDGELSGNLVEHAGVDSVIRNRLNIKAGETKIIDYWIVADNSQTDAEDVHRDLLKDGLGTRLAKARKWWHHWLSIGAGHMHQLEPEYLSIFKKSLMIVKAHIDSHGGMIASGDSSIYNYGRDYYAYVWPRDTALTMLPLIDLGYTTEPKRFLEFCADTIHRKGYMMHKYQPDRSIGSTWHPLMHRNHPELAIQEDETASVVYTAGKYFEATKDEEFIKRLYPVLIKPAANFMAGFIDEATNLPHASYDLWEERFATHTYSVAITMASLKEAAKLAMVCGKPEDAAEWRAAARRIAEGTKLLYNSEAQAFRKSIFVKDNGDLEFDNRLDMSSAYGVMLFADDGSGKNPALHKAMAASEAKLFNTSPSGGAVRYEGDNYFLERREYIGNPWIICTLWLAQYYITQKDNKRAKELIQWAIDHRTPHDMLSEQVDPLDGKPIGVTPLVWSHAELVQTLLMLNQLEHPSPESKKTD